MSKQGIQIQTASRSPVAVPQRSSSTHAAARFLAALHPLRELDAPPLVNEVLHSAGEPLNAQARLRMETSFQQDFSRVRVHNDAQAARSADAIHSLAYTAGWHVIFGAGRYAPYTTSGQQLLAHELAHVVQQRDAPAASGGRWTLDRTDDPAEREAALAGERAHARPALRAAPGQIQRQKKADEFPGYSQGTAITCGAASLISALMVWDKERKDPSAPNEMVVTAINIVLTHLDDHKKSIIQNWNSQGKKGDDLYNDMVSELGRIRDDARKPGSKIPEPDYQLISTCLVILFNNGTPGGLSKADIEGIQAKLGLTSGVQSATQAQSYDDLFADPVLKALKPGEAAQIFWYQQDKQGNPIVNPTHVFLVGRFQRGAWFVSDQGNSPATELEAATPDILKATLSAEVKAGRASIYTGVKPMLLPAPFTGVVKLGDRGGVEKQAENMILKPGEFLAEVDATTVCCGEKLYAWDFVARRYTKADAEAAFATSGTGHGGLIVENPLGLFHVFKTSPLKDKDNLKATGIDAGDSAGGFLMDHSRYHQAWLKLCLSASCNPSFFPVR